MCGCVNVWIALVSSQHLFVHSMSPDQPALWMQPQGAGARGGAPAVPAQLAHAHLLHRSVDAVVPTRSQPSSSCSCGPGLKHVPAHFQHAACHAVPKPCPFHTAFHRSAARVVQTAIMGLIISSMFARIQPVPTEGRNAVAISVGKMQLTYLSSVIWEAADLSV